MTTDHRIITRHGRYSVLGTPQRIVWPDDSTAELHPVSAGSTDDVYLRALLVDEDLHWVVVDLRTIERGLGQDLKQAMPYDRPGVVMYSLRCALSGADELRARALVNCRAAWQAEDDSPQACLWADFRQRVERVAA